MWASPGTPCASVFLPVAVFGGDGAVVPSVLGDEEVRGAPSRRSAGPSRRPATPVGRRSRRVRALAPSRRRRGPGRTSCGRCEPGRRRGWKPSPSGTPGSGPRCADDLARFDRGRGGQPMSKPMRDQAPGVRRRRRRRRAHPRAAGPVGALPRAQVPRPCPAVRARRPRSRAAGDRRATVDDEPPRLPRPSAPWARHDIGEMRRDPARAPTSARRRSAAWTRPSGSSSSTPRASTQWCSTVGLLWRPSSTTWS